MPIVYDARPPDTDPGGDAVATEQANLEGCLMKVARSNTSLPEMLEQISNSARVLVSAHRAAVFVYDKKTGDLKSTVSDGLKGIVITCKVGEGFVGYAAQTSKVRCSRAVEGRRDPPRRERTRD